MTRMCVLTGKRPVAGNNRNFSLKATRRTFRPNLFKRKIFNPFTGQMEKITISARGIKTFKKWSKEAEEKTAKNAKTEETITTETTEKAEKKSTKKTAKKLKPTEKKAAAKKAAERKVTE